MNEDVRSEKIHFFFNSHKQRKDQCIKFLDNENQKIFQLIHFQN